MVAPTLATPTVVYVHKDAEYAETVREFYRRFGLPGDPIFASDLSPTHQLAQERRPFILIICHFPGTPYDARLWAETTKKVHGDFVLGVYAHTVEPLTKLGDLDGVIPKDLVGGKGPFDQICHIIADMSRGMGREGILAKYPQILHN